MFTADQIEAFRQRHGRIQHVVGNEDEWEVVLFPPKGPDVKLYKAQLHDAALRSEAQEILFKKIVAGATVGGAECDAPTLLASYPMAPEGCSDAIQKLTGMAATSRGKT
jgi:hypothetical protein